MAKITLRNKKTGKEFPIDQQAWEKARHEWQNRYEEVTPVKDPPEVQALSKGHYKPPGKHISYDKPEK